MYSNLFSTLYVNVNGSVVAVDKDGNAIVDENGDYVRTRVVKSWPVRDLHVSKADLYLVLLALATDIEEKTEHQNAKNIAFLTTYNEVKCPGNKKFSLTRSVRRLLEVFRQNEGADFLPELRMPFNRWSRGHFTKKDGKRVFVSDTFDDECKYDPYVFSKSQANTTLSEASTVLLVKAFRFYLEETLRHFFRKSDPNTWYYYDDKTGRRVVSEYSYGGNRTSAQFQSVMSALLDVYDDVYNLSPHLEEFSVATKKAIEAGRIDRELKSTNKRLEKASNRTYETKEQTEPSQPKNKQKAQKNVKQEKPASERKPVAIKTTEIDGESWATHAKKGEAPQEASQEEMQEAPQAVSV